MAVKNRIDRFHLAIQAIEWLKASSGSRVINDADAECAIEDLRDRLKCHSEYIVAYGEDMPEVMTVEVVSRK